ncbi:hypothetical protein AGMMS49959_06460 [Planctomycetales bacterium]|nr:hypothetical protein AGMMS49959_06460 [Planctomycetales bacterium]
MPKYFTALLWIVALAAAAVGYLGIFPAVFGNPAPPNAATLTAMSLLTAALIAATVGQAPLATTGRFDFSVGGVFLLAHYFCAAPHPLWATVAALFVLALAAATLNTLGHCVLRLPNLLITALVGLIAAVLPPFIDLKRGDALVQFAASIGEFLPPSLAQTSPMDLSAATRFVVLLAMLLLTYFFLRSSVAGWQLRALGDDAKKARAFVPRGRLWVAYFFSALGGAAAALIGDGATPISQLSALLTDGLAENLATISLAAAPVPAFLGNGFLALALTSPVWCAAVGTAGQINIRRFLLNALAVAWLAAVVNWQLFGCFFSAALLLAGVAGRLQKRRYA